MTGPALPPVTQICMVSLSLVFASGVYLATKLPEEHVALGPAIAMLAAATLLFAGAMVALALVPGFPWRRFFEVARWALLAYTVIAAIIGLTFARNDVRGSELIVVTLSLALYALHVPALIAFTVARYYETEPE